MQYARHTWYNLQIKKESSYPYARFFENVFPTMKFFEQGDDSDADSVPLEYNWGYEGHDSNYQDSNDSNTDDDEYESSIDYTSKLMPPQTISVQTVSNFPDIVNHGSAPIPLDDDSKPGPKSSSSNSFSLLLALPSGEFAVDNTNESDVVLINDNGEPVGVDSDAPEAQELRELEKPTKTSAAFKEKGDFTLRAGDMIAMKNLFQGRNDEQKTAIVHKVSTSNTIEDNLGKIDCNNSNKGEKLSESKEPILKSIENMEENISIGKTRSTANTSTPEKKEVTIPSSLSYLGKAVVSTIAKSQDRVKIYSDIKSASEMGVNNFILKSSKDKSWRLIFRNELSKVLRNTFVAPLKKKLNTTNEIDTTALSKSTANHSTSDAPEGNHENQQSLNEFKRNIVDANNRFSTFTGNNISSVPAVTYTNQSFNSQIPLSHSTPIVPQTQRVPTYKP